MSIIEFEQMALISLSKSKIRNFDKMICSFNKWTSQDDAECRICIYVKDGRGQSAESAFPEDAIKEAIFKMEEQQNPREKTELTNI